MTTTQAQARCWAEIDLDALCANYESARSVITGGAQVIPVLKGNAYGLGAVPVMQALERAGARMFAVATVGEAVELHRAGAGDVLVMGAPGEPLIEAALQVGAQLTVYSPDEARAIDACAARLGVQARVHVKLDTGLHRIGLEPDRAAEQILQIADLPHLAVAGLYTHLALHDEARDQAQFDAFDRVRDQLAAKGLAPMAHVLDSIGLMRYPLRQYGAVRIGAWLYGVKPMRYACDAACLPVVSLKARVVQTRRVRAGEAVGYDNAALSRDTLVATISCGYADGYPRFVGRGQVEVRGMRADVLSCVCMDQFMIDVTDIPGVVAGDEVCLLGGGISIDEYAAWGGLNRNHALSLLSRRVGRVYRQGGAVWAIEDDDNP